jgi:AbrB family looped-hinge helix DNA binding protein
MKRRVGSKGQVVIPKGLRDQLSIEPGDEVDFWRDGEHLVLMPIRHRPPLKGRFEGSALTEDLAAQRQADRRDSRTSR